MQPNVQAFFDLATSTVSYLVSDPATKVSAIIDPVLDFEPKAARLSTSSADLILAAVAVGHILLLRLAVLAAVVTGVSILQQQEVGRPILEAAVAVLIIMALVVPAVPA